MSVRLIDVTKIFEDPTRSEGKITAVDRVNLEVAEGEFVTFLGPSGCGKTTTLRIVSGFEAPTEGDIIIAGRRVNDDPPNKRDTSMVFQSYAIFPHMSVVQNISFGLELKGRPKAVVREETARIMDVMGLSSMAKRRPDQLSGGQQQRVALARAIVNRPKVLLFDEPLSNLDAKLRDQMRLEIRRIQQTFGITSIYVTHDQIEAMTVSDRIVVMDKGRVMQVGTPFEVYSRPANRFVADFIGRVNFFDGRVVEGGDPLRVDLGGKTVEVGSRVPGVVEGGRAVVAVRPESLRLHPANEGGPSFATGKVTKAVYLGSVIEYELDAGFDRPVLAVSHDPVDAGFFTVGDIVALDFSARAAHALASEILKPLPATSGIA
ncbi:MAG: polyamine ABC transporter ATP-binding protein [Spirochaetae bacterium HGW-Spirochaetae-7]|nr:MAG: polyamine ABC transporter ATP-binding protein [Spirochaetae bacterium HGW-Spirochaetae-7]